MEKPHSSLLAGEGRSPQPPTTFSAWLRARLSPNGDNLMVLAAYAMILAAIISFVLMPPVLPPWRFYGTLLALSALLAINALLPASPPGLEPFGRKLFGWGFFVLSSGLVLLAIGLGAGQGWTFLPFLLFMLVAQVTASWPLRYALLYSILLLASYLALVATLSASLDDVIGNFVSVGMGMLFVIIFSLVAVRYSEQTRRAEALLTELKTANAELAAAREREKELAVAQERVRLAREIHDGLGHHLTVLNVQLQAAAKLVERDPSRATAVLATCREVAQAALEEVRQSVAAMRRTPPDDRPLGEALAALVRDFQHHTAIAVRFEQHGADIALSPAAAMTLYRAAQEGLTNMQKHADVQCATVLLSFGPSTVRLRVENDGVDKSAMEQGGGFGLAGLRERAEHLGGSLTAEPRSPNGFVLEMLLPAGIQSGPAL